MKEWKKVSQSNRARKQASVTVIISDKTDMKLNLVKSDKRNFLMLIIIIVDFNPSLFQIDEPDQKVNKLCYLNIF